MTGVPTARCARAHSIPQVDVASFAEHGYALERLRAFDLFPMTHHVECVALLRPAS